jgi:leucyl-tRNA synthetase
MDMRVSGKDLIRNHLTMSLYNHAAIWKENREQRMTRSYFCNGYLCLNGAKMAKSTGNFMTMRDCISKFGVSSTRIALADAGDSLDDANFDEQVANAAILKLFVLEGWIKTHAVFDKALESDVQNHNLWDRMVFNEWQMIIEKVKAAYDEMKIKKVITYAFNEMLNLKENWLIAQGNTPCNPHLMNRFIHDMLIMMNPIVPQFCEHVWDSIMAPCLKSCG